MESQTNLGKPYVPMFVEEISKVTDLRQWSNTNVRVVGMIEQPTMLVSVLEQGGPHRIRVDLRLIDTLPPQNVTVQVFGELEIIPCSGAPQIKVFFLRRVNAFYVDLYHRAIELQKKYIPHFFKPANS